MRDYIAERRWLLPFGAIILLWLTLVILTERISLYSLSGVATSASFLLFSAVGQMLVITTGRGNIDLSIPGTVTLSAYLTVVVSGGQNAGLGMAVITVLATGVLIGLLNAGLVLVLRIPAMIATLATGYILASATLLVNAMVKIMGTPPLLATIAAGRIGALPIVFLLATALTVFAGLILGYSAYGRKLLALGQSREAARLTGIAVNRVEASAFVVSAVLSAIAGMLLSGYAAGAFLEMGTPFLLQSVGAVILGGTLIAGGSATAAGTLFGGILLVLIVTTLQIAGLPHGLQDIVQGLFIIAALSISGLRTK